MAAQTTQLGFTLTPPTKDGFGGAPWKHDANLAMLADRVMTAHPERFRVASQYSIEYLWRAKGGTSRGEPKFADCIKLGGLAYHFSSADFVIWFAADHLTKYGFKEREFEALMFRQLMHIGSNENTGSAVLVPFDFKGFNAELVEYGPWDEALKKMSHTLQPTLFDGEADDQEEGAEDETGGVVVPIRAEQPEDLPPAETLPTTDLAAEAMAEAGWTLPPTTNGHPRTDADAEAEANFAASRRK
jgi:hypothetical protein